MPLVSPVKMVATASKANRAIGSFNVLNLEMIRAVIEAAEESNKPLIIAVSAKTAKWAKLTYILPLALIAARNASVDIAVHIDHFSDLKSIQKAILMGVTSVMYDGSHFDYVKNTSAALKVNKLVANQNIATEFEVGHIGGKHSNDTSVSVSLEIIKRFYDQTKPSFLAFPFGTAHGLSQSSENLDFDLIEKVSKATKALLVMHGTSNVNYENIKKAITAGIAKVNIGSELLLSNNQAIRKYLLENPVEYDIRKINEPGIIAMKNKVMKYLKLLDNAGK